MKLDLQKQREVKHSRTKPSIWDELERRYHVKWERTALAYGDTIYAADVLPADVEAHERVHLHQQGYTTEGARVWWERYLNEPEFMYAQELEAYRAQYQFLRKTVKDRNELTRRLRRLAELLSGDMYGNLVTFDEALKAISK